MKMHVLSGGRLKMRKHIYFPDADRSETIELPVNCILLRHPKGNVLFDTGCHPDVAGDAEGRWGPLARVMTPLMPAGDNVLNGLKAIGLTPDDIDVVVCSHLHPDHCGCNQFFRKARILVRQEELAAALGVSRQSADEHERPARTAHLGTPPTEHSPALACSWSRHQGPRKPNQYRGSAPRGSWTWPGSSHRRSCPATPMQS